MRNNLKLRHLIAVLVTLIAMTVGTLASASTAAAKREPYILLNEATGPPGTAITVSGCGFLPNLRIQISHPGLTGSDENKADEGGCVSENIFHVADDTPPGIVEILYRQAEHIAARAHFTVQGR